MLELASFSIFAIVIFGSWIYRLLVWWNESNVIVLVKVFLYDFLRVLNHNTFVKLDLLVNASE